MANKDLTFRLFGEDRTASSSLTRLSDHADSVSARIGRGFAGAGRILGGLGLAAAGAAAAGAAAIVATGIGEAMDASKGVAQLQAGLKSTDNAANVTVKHMEDLASSIQGMSGQTDDSIVSAQSLLLTFTNIKNNGPDKIFDQATMAAADMAARMGGDASSNAVRLGKALNDPVKGITALSKVGVSFTESQKDAIKAMVKTGDTAGAQKLILKELNNEFGGSAKAAGQSLPGQLERAKRAFEDMSQTVVETILPVVTPAIEGIAGAVKAASPFLESMAEVVRDKLAAGLKILGGFIGPLFSQLTSGASGSAPKIMQLAQAVGDHLKGAFDKILPAVMPLVQRIPGLIQQIIPVFAKLYTAVVDAVGQIVPPLMRVVQTVLPFIVQAFKMIVPPVVSVFKSIVAAVAPLLQLLSIVLPPVFKALLTYIEPVFTTIVTVIRAALRIVQGVIQTVMGVVTGNWKQAWTGIQNVFGGILDAIVGIVMGWVNRFAKPFQQAWNQVSSGFRSSWAKITGFISDAIDNVVDFVVGGTRTLVSTWQRGWNTIVSAVSAVNGRIAAGVRSVINTVVGFFSSLGGRVKAAIGNAGAMLLGVGRDIIAGLVNGIRGGASSVISALGNIVTDAIATAKKKLGIASPSKVFKQIGAWLGQGFAEGIDGTRDQVLGVMKDLVDKVKAIPDKAFKGTGVTKSAIVKSLEADTTALGRLAQRRDKLAADLKAAQESLQAAVDTRDSYRATVANGAAALGLASTTKGVTDADGNTAAVTAADVLKTKQSALDNTSSFLTQIGQLKGLGLNSDDYKSIVDSFQQSGDTSIASALLSGGKGAVDELNQLNERLNATADQLGQRTSNRLYQAGVDSIRDLANGLQDQVAAVTGAMGVVQQSMAGSLKKLGIDTSDLSKQAGRDIADGVAVGLKDKRSALNGVFEDLADGWVKTIKTKLKIKSPSGVFRDDVGSMIPAGVADGIRVGATDIDRELAAMVKVPAYATAPGTVGQPGLVQTATGSRAMVHIENFHATPEQSPADIAADLGWLARGGL